MRARTHQPLRTCAGCRRNRPKAELLRLVCESGRKVKIDSDLRLPGRGAYLCVDTAQACLQTAQRRRSLSRSLAVGDDVLDYQSLGAQLARDFPEELQ